MLWWDSLNVNKPSFLKPVSEQGTGELVCSQYGGRLRMNIGGRRRECSATEMKRRKAGHGVHVISSIVEVVHPS